MEHEIKLSWFEALQIKFSAEKNIKEFKEMIEYAEKSETLSQPEYENHRENLAYYLEQWENILAKMEYFLEKH